MNQYRTHQSQFHYEKKIVSTEIIANKKYLSKRPKIILYII